MNNQVIKNSGLSKLIYISILILLWVFSGVSLAGEPIAVAKDRLWPSINYLDSAKEGLYEVVYSAKQNMVFAAAIDKVKKTDNIGFIYAFNPQTLEKVAKYPMPMRVFSLVENPQKNWLYAGHTQHLAISKVDAKTGKVLVTSEKFALTKKSLHEHLRHMVYNPLTNELFVTYIAIVMRKSQLTAENKLLVLDGDTLELKGEVADAYPTPGFGLTIDLTTQKIYTAGHFIQEIDARTKKVVRSISVDDSKPSVTMLGELTIDSKQKRLFANHFAVNGESFGNPINDGLFVYDLKTAKQLAYIKTGDGPLGIRYSPKHKEIYVANFRSGTLSVVDAKTYQILLDIKTPVFPNLLSLSQDESALYMSVKQGFSRQWNPHEFVRGAKEQIMSISLDSEIKQSDKK